eukprot:g4458.t1
MTPRSGFQPQRRQLGGQQLFIAAVFLVLAASVVPALKFIDQDPLIPFSATSRTAARILSAGENSQSSADGTFTLPGISLTEVQQKQPQRDGCPELLASLVPHGAQVWLGAPGWGVICKSDPLTAASASEHQEEPLEQLQLPLQLFQAFFLKKAWADFLRHARGQGAGEEGSGISAEATVVNDTQLPLSLPALFEGVDVEEDVVDDARIRRALALLLQANVRATNRSTTAPEMSSEYDTDTVYERLRELYTPNAAGLQFPQGSLSFNSSEEFVALLAAVEDVAVFGGPPGAHDESANEDQEGARRPLASLFRPELRLAVGRCEGAGDEVGDAGKDDVAGAATEAAAHAENLASMSYLPPPPSPIIPTAVELFFDNFKSVTDLLGKKWKESAAVQQPAGEEHFGLLVFPKPLPANTEERRVREAVLNNTQAAAQSFFTLLNRRDAAAQTDWTTTATTDGGAADSAAYLCQVYSHVVIPDVMSSSSNTGLPAAAVPAPSSALLQQESNRHGHRRFGGAVPGEVAQEQGAAVGAPPPAPALATQTHVEMPVGAPIIDRLWVPDARSVGVPFLGSDASAVTVLGVSDLRVQQSSTVSVVASPSDGPSEGGASALPVLAVATNPVTFITTSTTTSGGGPDGTVDPDVAEQQFSTAGCSRTDNQNNTAQRWSAEIRDGAKLVTKILVLNDASAPEGLDTAKLLLDGVEFLVEGTGNATSSPGEAQQLVKTFSVNREVQRIEFVTTAIPSENFVGGDLQDEYHPLAICGVKIMVNSNQGKSAYLPGEVFQVLEARSFEQQDVMEVGSAAPGESMVQVEEAGEQQEQSATATPTSGTAAAALQHTSKTMTFGVFPPTAAVPSLLSSALVPAGNEIAVADALSTAAATNSATDLGWVPVYYGYGGVPLVRRMTDAEATDYLAAQTTSTESGTTPSYSDVLCEPVICPSEEYTCVDGFCEYRLETRQTKPVCRPDFCSAAYQQASPRERDNMRAVCVQRLRPLISYSSPNSFGEGTSGTAPLQPPRNRYPEQSVRSKEELCRMDARYLLRDEGEGALSPLLAGVPCVLYASDAPRWYRDEIRLLEPVSALGTAAATTTSTTTTTSLTNFLGLDVEQLQKKEGLRAPVVGLSGGGVPLVGFPGVAPGRAGMYDTTTQWLSAVSDVPEWGIGMPEFEHFEEFDPEECPPVHEDEFEHF